jgi:hypothetical protein
MGKRLVSLLTALALAVSAFASLTVAPAGAVVEEITNRIYFPFVPNGEEYGNMGPWYGTVTVQNPNGVDITIQLRKANGDVITTATLEPFAAKTWNSSALFGDGNGGGVVVLGPSAQVTPAGGIRLTVFRGEAPDTVDKIPNPCSGGFDAVRSVTIRQGDTVFTEYPNDDSGDYTLLDDPTEPGEYIWIAWWQDEDGDGEFDDDEESPGPAEPADGTSYTVEIRCEGAMFPVLDLPIAGVAKIVAPVASNSGRTSAQHETVSGYSALPQTDVEIGGQHNLVFPIAQTNTGWNSVLHITNFDSRNNCSVTVTLYQSPSGYSDPSYGQFTKLLNKGQTWHIDLADQGVPAGWVGQAWVSTDCNVAATVDRVKPTQPWGDPVNMALTNQALPVQAANTNQALPLIFQGYNGWNTGISIANLDPNAAANVTITYYNSAGVAVGTDTRVIQPRAMEFVYRPATTDVGIGGFGSALVTSNRPVLVAVDSVKYTGADQDVGQALGYLAQRGTPGAGQLFMPLFQKQGLLSGGNDNSGVALFNAGNASATVWLGFFDSSGALVAPTLTAPITAVIPAHGGFIAYAPSYGEMPGGFQGSVVALASGFVVGVSNNVNYDVQFDGSAAYNMPVAEDVASVTCTPAEEEDIAVGDDVADCTITGQLAAPFAGQPVLLQITGESTGDNVSFDDTDNVDVIDGVTDANGEFSADGYLIGTSASPVTFTVNFYYDANNNGTVDAGDILLATAECELRWQQGG